MASMIQIQTALKKAGVNPGPIDGVKGPKTVDAIRRFQSAKGLTVDGVIGPKTLAALGLREASMGDLVQGTGHNIKRIAIHCSATREGQDIDAATIRRWHKQKGWSDIGYHFVIMLDGEIQRGRSESRVGSHVKGFNTGSIGVVYVGGLDSQGRPKDTRTPEQKRAMARLVKELVSAYPGADVLGHRDHSPDLDGDGQIEPHEWLKDCPCFDVRSWWKSVQS